MILATGPIVKAKGRLLRRIVLEVEYTENVPEYFSVSTQCWTEEGNSVFYYTRYFPCNQVKTEADIMEQFNEALSFFNDKVQFTCKNYNDLFNPTAINHQKSLKQDS